MTIAGTPIPMTDRERLLVRINLAAAGGLAYLDRMPAIRPSDRAPCQMNACDFLDPPCSGSYTSGGCSESHVYHHTNHRRAR